MIALISLAAGLSAWFVFGRGPRYDIGVAAERLSGFDLQRAQPRSRRLAIVKRALAVIGRWVPANNDSLLKPLTAAGLQEADPAVMRGVQALAAAGGVLLSLQAGRLAIMAAPAMAAAAWRAPLIILKRRAQARRMQIAEDLPDVVDLLAVCTQAGLNVALALKRVAETTEGVLGSELRNVVTQTELGTTREAALRDFAAATGLADAEALVNALTSAEAFGSEVSESLSSLSGEMRQRRRRSVEEQARKAPVKILFPLVFVILPAFLLLTVVPLLLGTLDSLSYF